MVDDLEEAPRSVSAPRMRSSGQAGADARPAAAQPRTSRTRLEGPSRCAQPIIHASSSHPSMSVGTKTIWLLSNLNGTLAREQCHLHRVCCLFTFSIKVGTRTAGLRSDLVRDQGQKVLIHLHGVGCLLSVPVDACWHQTDCATQPFGWSSGSGRSGSASICMGWAAL